MSVLPPLACALIVVLIGRAVRPGTTRTLSTRHQTAPTMSRRRRRRSIDQAFPDVLDLLIVTVQAGHLPLDALRALRPIVPSTIGAAFGTVLERVDRGERFADALDSLSDAFGPGGSTLVETLTLTERAGLPLAPALDRLADDARQHRRRQAEANARQLPVRLSFPLVLCTLTSFVLVAIVPLLLGALTSFDRSSP